MPDCTPRTATAERRGRGGMTAGNEGVLVVVVQVRVVRAVGETEREGERGREGTEEKTETEDARSEECNTKCQGATISVRVRSCHKYVRKHNIDEEEISIDTKEEPPAQEGRTANRREQEAGEGAESGNRRMVTVGDNNTNTRIRWRCTNGVKLLEGRGSRWVVGGRYSAGHDTGRRSQHAEAQKRSGRLARGVMIRDQG